MHVIANPKRKTLLRMAAPNAVTFNDGRKACCRRKVAEGKNPVSVLNAVRFTFICPPFFRGETKKKPSKRLRENCRVKIW